MLDPSDCHILVVDDERISQVMVSSLLRKCNYKGKLHHLTCVASHEPCTTAHLHALWLLPYRRDNPISILSCLPSLHSVTVAQGGSEAMEVLQRAAPGSFSLVLTVSLRDETTTYDSETLPPVHKAIVEQICRIASNPL